MDMYISQALDEYVTDAQNLLDAALLQKPCDQAEIGYWRAQRNAYVKAQRYYLEGVRLTATPSGYLVASASRPGALVHRMYRIGDVWACSCEAGTRGIFHWHHALLHAYERGAELAALAALPALPTRLAEEDAALLELSMA